MSKPVSARLVNLPNLSRRSLVCRVPPAVKLAITPRPSPGAQKTTLPRPPAASPAVKEHSGASGALRPQPIPALRHVHVHYQTGPARPDQLDGIRQLRGRGRGKVLVIIGNGPSINEAPLELLRGHGRIDLMSVNKPDPRLWPTELWAFCDTSQFRRHEELWRTYEGTIINSTAVFQRRPGTVQVRALQGFGFSRDLTEGFYIGRSTVYANLQTAHWMDYDHVYCLGVDMNPEGLHGQLWFYGHNPDAPPLQRKDRFRLEAEHYSRAARELSEEERARYTFCSAYNPWEFVDKFNRLDHRLAVQHILQKFGDNHDGQ